MSPAPGPLFIAAAPIVGTLMEKILKPGDTPPEAEKLARELRKRLDNARDLVENWAEYAGMAEHARLRAEIEKGKERKKWARRAARLNAKAQGYRIGVNVIYSELAMFVPPSMSQVPVVVEPPGPQV